MADYATDADLVAKRSNIINLAPEGDWDDKHAEATEAINRDLKSEWFNKILAEQGLDVDAYTFDPDLIKNPTDLKNLGVYKALELIYEYLSKDVVDCPFAKERDYYAEKYRDEFQRVVSSGLDYDWNESGTIDEGEERQETLPRTLERM